jgi:diguanylate cyclase (GGDEF)-like protein
MPASKPDRPIESLADTAVPVQAGQLDLDLALQLLARARHVWPEGAPRGSTAWLQSLVDGLCTLSSRDPLTGLVNRRQFEAVLDREVDRVARTGETALLLMLDIDHFKRVNDAYGHPAGDRVIRTVAKLLQKSVRPMDTVARIGGEEFAIVLPSCSPNFGAGVAERIGRNIARFPIAIETGRHLQVTISLGGAFVHPWVRSSRRLWIERADLQLYRAKDEGRNRACLESPPLSQVSPEERDLLLRPPWRRSADNPDTSFTTLTSDSS